MKQSLRKSVGLWILQRITAVLLVVFLGLHLWVSNFSTDWAVSLRALIDLTLLGLALFHGLNGVRAIILDFGLGSQGRRYLAVSLVMLGFVAFLFGVYGFWPLVFTK
jgi:succinate dehydrogenase / fumarate reductase membrane anchor subunit